MENDLTEFSVQAVTQGIDALAEVTIRIRRQDAPGKPSIWARLAARGSVVGNHDLWIAATALSHGFGVATRDARDFERVPGLRVLAATR